jgi:predicted AAA+ superfamily ATPase
MLFALFTCFFIKSDTQASQNEPVVKFVSTEDRKVFRAKLVGDLVGKYHQKQIFDQINNYMIEKAEELHRNQPTKLPDVLITDTFNKTEALFNRTKNFIGDSFVTSYAPNNFEQNVNKYLWLKGVGFWVLGIGVEHQMAFSYFYLPGNENLKEDFLKEIVQYSFPEIPEIEANQLWYDQMVIVMGRLGYKIFNVKRFGIAVNN